MQRRSTSLPSGGQGVALAAAIAFADPVGDQLTQLRQLHRLGHVPVHADQPRAFLVFAEDVRGERHHRGMRALFVGFPGAELLGGGEAVRTGISQSISTRSYWVAFIALSASWPLLAVSGWRLSLFNMPRMTLVEMLLSSATRIRKSLGRLGACASLAGCR